MRHEGLLLRGVMSVLHARRQLRPCYAVESISRASLVSRSPAGPFAPGFVRADGEARGDGAVDGKTEAGRVQASKCLASMATLFLLPDACARRRWRPAADQAAVILDCPGAGSVATL